ncbi:MAG: MATE family efflux transporter [Lachnospiraceae bacterium]|jgi:putative MATE family efflux protein|nr:MATE family efflux transporter [Lachnospiraceae bacterium]
MSDKKTRVGLDLTDGSIVKNLVIYAAPLLLTHLIQQLYGAVDLMIIGHFGDSSGTVGVATGGDIPDLLSFMSLAFAGAGQIFIAQLVGAKNNVKLKNATRTIISFMLILSVFFMVVSLIGCRAFLKLLNTPAEAFAPSYQYMMIVSIGLPFVFEYNAICCILRGMGESKMPLIFIIIAATSNIFMDLLMVVVLHLGAAGTAIATVIAQIACFVASVVYMYIKRRQLNIEFNRSLLKIDRVSLFVMLKQGIPMALSGVCIQLSQLFCKSFINQYGVVASATNSIGDKLVRLVNVIMLGINQGGGAIIAQNFGARNFERVRKTVYTCLKAGAIMAVINCLLAIFIPKQMFGVFTKDPEVLELGMVFMRITIFTFIFSAFMGTFNGLVTGCGNARLNFISGMLDGVVLRISISFVLAYVFDMGIVGFFWGNSLARLAPLIIGCVYFLSGRWEKRKLLGE